MEQKLLDIVATNVRLFRKAAELSQSSLAAASGLSLYAIKKIEAGTSNESEIVAVARALNRPIGDLLTKPLTLEHIRFCTHSQLY